MNAFVVISWNWRKIIPYKVPNKVGKITTKVYIEDILPAMVDELKERGLALCQDADSAHKAGATLRWAKEHDLPVLTLPEVSPDFSILESLALPCKRKFHAIRCASEQAGLARFTKIFEEEIDQKTIQEYYQWYTKRLYECRRLGGQMTRY